MEPNNLKVNTLLFFFNAMKDLHKGIDCALDQLNNDMLDEHEKFNLIIELIGNFGLNQDLFINEVCGPAKPKEDKPEIGGPIQRFDYHDFPEERFEILLLNGLVGFNIPLN